MVQRSTQRGRRSRWGRRGVAGALVLLTLALAAGAQESAPAPQAEDDRGFWLLTEFDWGDDPETVRDSIGVSPGLRCAQGSSSCSLVRVSVDGEDVLARFDYERKQRKSLWRVAFVTPLLDRKQANAHLARVWRKLVGYVSRFQAAPLLATELPSLDSLGEGEPHYTHYWKSDDMEIRIVLGLAYGKYFVGAFFSDPAQAYRAQEGLAPRPPKGERRAARQEAAPAP